MTARPPAVKTKALRADGAHRSAADGDGRKRQPRGSRRRQQILDAAVEVFAVQGFRASGIPVLAHRVGLTPPGVLYYFGTKQRLLEELVADRDRKDAPDTPLTFEQVCERVLAGYPNRQMIRLFAVLGVENLDPEDPLHDYFVHRYSGGRAYWQALIVAEQEAGRFRADVDAEARAAQILSVLLGAELQWLTDPEHVDVREVIGSYLEALQEELRA